MWEKEPMDLTKRLLDRHNDVITVYSEVIGENAFKISDDFYTLQDLKISGVDIPKDSLTEVLEKYNITETDGELYVIFNGMRMTSIYNQRVQDLRNAMYELSHMI